VLDANPDLTVHGIGTPDEHHGYCTSSLKHEVAHRQFYNVDANHVGRVVEWLKGWPRTHSINPHAPGSYGFKHIVEADIDEYVSNGEFILAALISGVRIERYPDSPNVAFNLTRSGCQPCGRCSQPIVYGSYGPDGHDHVAIPGSLTKPGRYPKHWRHRRAASRRELIRQAFAVAEREAP
jgi:hypothetical protein